MNRPIRSNHLGGDDRIEATFAPMFNTRIPDFISLPAKSRSHSSYAPRHTYSAIWPSVTIETVCLPAAKVIGH